MKNRTKISMGILFITIPLLTILHNSEGLYIYDIASMVTTSDFSELLLYIAIFLIPIVITPVLLIIVINDIIKMVRQKINKIINQKLNYKILKVGSSANKPLSIYELMGFINEDEKKITDELNKMVAKGLVTQIFTESGLLLYKFSYNLPDEDRKDILS